MKYFRMSFDEVVYKRSFINLILLNRAIPGIKPFNKDDDGGSHTRHEKVTRKKAGNQHANQFFEQLM